MAVDDVQPAVQLVAFVDDHVSVVEAPALIVCGLAVRLTVGGDVPPPPLPPPLPGGGGGGGGAFTVTVVLADALPPEPVQVSEYVVVDDGTTTAWPLVGMPPLQLPLQLAAFVDAHVSVEEAPAVIVSGYALIATDGGGGGALTVTVSPDVAVVPAPAQVMTYVYVPGVFSGPVDSEPLIGFDPPHAPDAVQLVMFDPLHVIVDDWPVTIDVGDARSETDG